MPETCPTTFGDVVVMLDADCSARAKSHTTEIKGASHSVYESHPRKVAAMIADAARSAQK